MYWKPMGQLYQPGEMVPPVWDQIAQRACIPVAYANTEMFAKCNLAIKLDNGHIVVDDYEADELNGKTFRNEEAFRRGVGLDNDAEIVFDLFGGR